MEGEGGDEIAAEITTLLSEMPGHSDPTPRSDESVDSSRTTETSRSHPHPYHLKNKYTFRSDSVYSDVVPMSAASNKTSGEFISLHNDRTFYIVLFKMWINPTNWWRGTLNTGWGCPYSGNSLIFMTPVLTVPESNDGMKTRKIKMGKPYIGKVSIIIISRNFLGLLIVNCICSQSQSIYYEMTFTYLV